MAGEFNPFQDTRVYGSHDFRDGQRPLIVAWQALQCRLGFGIEPTGSVGLKAEKVLKLRAVFALKEVRFRTVEPGEIFLREVDPSLLGVRSKIAKDVRKLKSHAEVDGIILGMR